MICCYGVWLSQHGRLLSLLLSNDKSAFCCILRVPPLLLLWPDVFFFLSPPLIRSQTITRRAVTLLASGMPEKLHDLGTFVGLMGCCGSAWWDAIHLFLFSFRLLWYATSQDQAMEAWKGWRIALALRLRQPQVLHAVAFLCFWSLRVSVAAAIKTKINTPSIFFRISSPGNPSVSRAVRALKYLIWNKIEHLKKSLKL